MEDSIHKAGEVFDCGRSIDFRASCNTRETLIRRLPQITVIVKRLVSQLSRSPVNEALTSVESA